MAKPTLTILVAYSKDGTFPDFPEVKKPGDMIRGIELTSEKFFAELRKCETAEERVKQVESALNMLFFRCPLGEVEDVSNA